MSTGSSKGRLGDILVEQDVIKPDDLEKALKESKRTAALIGDVLVMRKYCTRDQIVKALSVQFDIPVYNPAEDRFDSGLIGKIDSNKVNENQIFPLYINNGKLVVAIVDPTNIQAEENVHHSFNLDLDRRIIHPDEFQKLIRDHLGLSMQVRSLIERISKEEETSDIGVDLGPRLERLTKEKLPELPPTAQLEFSIVAEAIRRGASDIHFRPMGPGIVILYRIDGWLENVLVIQDPAIARRILARIKVSAGCESHEWRKKQEGRINYDIDGIDVYVRVAIHPIVAKEGSNTQLIVMRLLRQGNIAVNFGDLGLSPVNETLLNELIERPSGIVQIVGPTGSGKSTTLASILTRLNTGDRNIITIEDPVEYHIENVNQVEVNTNPHVDIRFENVIMSFLRSDPDIIMIGETRNRETAQAAADAANTGHLVFTTLHANNAAGVPARLNELGVERYLINNTTSGVIAQRLLPILCPKCRISLEPGSPDFHSQIEIMNGAYDPSDDKYRDGIMIFENAPSGCPYCNYKGFKGRTGTFEIMVITNKMRKLIEETLSIHRIKALAYEEGTRSMWQDSVEKVLAGITTLNAVLKTVERDEVIPA